MIGGRQMRKLSKSVLAMILLMLIFCNEIKVSAGTSGEIKGRYSSSTSWTDSGFVNASIPVGYEPLDIYVTQKSQKRIYIINAATGDILYRLYNSESWVDLGGRDTPIPTGYVPLGVHEVVDDGDIWFVIRIANPTTGSVQERAPNDGIWYTARFYTYNFTDLPFPAGYEAFENNEVGLFIINPITGDVQTRSYNSTVWNHAANYADVPIPIGYEPLGVDPGNSYLFIIKTNKAPSIELISPIENKVYSAVSSYNMLTISGTVNDADAGDIITTKYNIDGGTIQTIAGTVTTSGTTNTSIDAGALSEGNHNLNIWVEDNYGKSSSITVIPFKVDKTAPALGNIAINSTTNSISISGSATDSVAGLDANPYRFTLSTKSPMSWTTLTSHTYDGLTPNTQYTATFEAKDKSGNISNSMQNIYTKATVPSITVSNPTSFMLDLTISDNNPTTTQYQIVANNSQYVTAEEFLTASPSWVTLSQKKISLKNLLPSTNYTFQVKAKNAEGTETEWSAPFSGTTLVAPPVPPSNITATATSKTITLSWDPVAGSIGYDLEADGRLIDNGDSTSYFHPGLTPYTPHTYKVRAKNAGGAGAWSEVVTKLTDRDTPNSPINVDAAANNTSIIVTWKSIDFASDYDIEVDGVIVNNLSSTSYVHTGLIPGTMHSYRVRSINSGSKSPWSNEILISTQVEIPLAPSNLSATASGGQATVTWNSIQGATYEIEVDGNIRDNGTSNTFIHSNLASGSSHNYRVRTKKSGSLSDWSSFITATLPLSEFGTPSNILAEANDTTVNLSWNSVIDAISYEIELNGSIVNNPTKANCIFNLLTPNTQYIYRVRAKGIDKVSEWSEYKTVMTYALPTPTNLRTIASGDTISITWDGVAGTESYDLDIDGQLIPSITTTSYMNPVLVSNIQHTYKVRAKNVLGISAWSKIFNYTPQSGGNNAPTGIIGVSMNDSIYFMWKPMNDATSYDIEVDGTIVQGITNVNYTHTGLEPGTQHTYRVRAVTNGVQSEWSNTSVVMTLPVAPPTPTNVTASSTTSSVLITWDKIEDAAAYELEVDGQIIDTGINTKYLHSNLAPDSSHTYRVRAKNVSDWSLWSEALTIKTKSSVQIYDIQIANGQVFNLVLTANDIADPSKYTYTITYNADELEVLDLCSATSRIDMTVGGVVGTDIQIVQFTPGTIVFKKLGTLTGQAWTGQINSIKFKSKTEQSTQVIYSFE
jgi:hypothetical protein